MPTVIDAFLVSLDLDGKKFEQGMKAAEKSQLDIRIALETTNKAEKKNAAERDKRIKSGTDGFRKMRNEVLALAAVFTAGVGIKDFITNTINGAVNLGYLSQNLGMSTERIKAFQLASERAGGTQEGFAAQLKESVDAIAELQTGGGPNAGMQAFFRWGGSSKDLKDGNTYLLARAKIIQDLFAKDPGQASLIAKQMGISEDQFNFIKLGPAAIEELTRAQEKNAATSKADAEAALKLRNQVLELRDSLTVTAQRIVLRLAPAFEKLFAQLERGADWVAEHKDEIAEWVDESVKAVTEFIEIANKAADTVGGWKNVLAGLVGLKVAGFAASLVSMGAGIVTALGPATLALGAFAAAYAGVRALNDATGGKLDDWVGEAMEAVGIKGASYKAAKLKPRSAADLAAADQFSGDFKRRAAVTTPDAASAAARLSALEKKYGLPKGLLDSIWNTESARGKNMRSSAGAMGHFQFMPATAAEYGLQNPDDFNESSDAAARKLRDLLKMYKGDLSKASAAYNWGQGNLNKYGLANAPAETTNYVRRTMRDVSAARGSTTTVNVENITVNTKATDAKGIASSIGPAVERYGFSNSANTGVTP